MAKFQDDMAGIGYYQFIEKLEKEFTERKGQVIAELHSLMDEIFCQELLSISYTGEPQSLTEAMELTEKLKDSLPKREEETGVYNIYCEKKNEGFKTSGQVQYVAQAGNFCDKGYAYTGALEILKVALSYDYLWMNLRVKGGAYGCMSGFRRNGESYFVSYRDPNLDRTLDVYAGIPEYTRNFTADEREMTKYIIGTISGKDVPKTPQMKGNVSKAAYFSSVTREMIQKERDQILQATQEDIRALAPIIEAILSDRQICVVGSENAIEKSKDIFMETKSLISC
jgi:hypothetical protein